MKKDSLCNVVVMMIACVVIPSCSSNGAGPAPQNPTGPSTPERGSIRVTTNAEGDPLSLDPDGMTIILDQAMKAIATNGTMNFLDLEVGVHDVKLEGVAAHCTVLGENPRQESVLANQVTSVDFSITCENWTLPIVVRTITGGSQVDVDGYTVSLDGESALPIGINDSLIYANVSTGRHEVVLDGIDARCEPPVQNPQGVFLSARFTRVEMNFRVTC